MHLDLFRLSGSVFLLSWTLDAPSFGRPGVSLVGGGKRLASAAVTLGLSDGRERVVVAFRHGGHDGIVATLSDQGTAGDITARFDPALVHGMSEPAEILRDLTPKARLALASALVGPWPSLFGLSATASYLSFLRQFLLCLSPKPAPALPVAALVEGKVLVETSVQGGLSPIKSIHRLDSAATGKAGAGLGERQSRNWRRNER
jgi:hypothetical protein